MFNAFRSYLNGEKNLSQKTIKAYNTDMQQFQEFCREKTIDGWEQIDNLLIRSYLAKLMQQGYSRTSIGPKAGISPGIFYVFTTGRSMYK